jgi:hypothetical protein
MVSSFPLEILRVSGSNYEMGSKIGNHFKAKISDFIKSSESFNEARKIMDTSKYEKVLELANRRFPQYMDEIRGISEGSGVDYEDLVLLNFKYEIPRLFCSTIISKLGDDIILGHNEDGERVNEENAFLLIANPLGGSPFFAYCYPGMIPGNAFSFNSHGVVMTGNYMPTPDPRIGVPRHLIDRFMLEAATIDAALERALLPQRASGFSYNIVSLREKRAINLETTSQRYHVSEVNDRFFHTNHYVSAGLGDIGQTIKASSRVRYGQGVEMMTKLGEVTEKNILEILFSTANTPYSIYASGGPGSSWTLCTAIFEVSDDVILKICARKERNCDPITFSSNIFSR